MSTLPLIPPKFRAFDANGDPLVGGRLYSFAAGTSTPQDTFTTRAGTIANTNPVILDANGEADVWTTPGLLYKFTLKDTADVEQWSVDNYPSGEQVASTTSGLAATVDPGGRITLVSGSPVTTIDISAATTIFYTPHIHNRVPLWDGGQWSLTAITELSQALSDATKSPAAAVLNSNYDLFIWDDAGTIRLSRGPPWVSNTDRGSGAGTTQLTRAEGRWVNGWGISNGPGAFLGTYVGTIRTNADAKAYDIVNQRFVWNAYNRVPRPMLVRETTGAASWTYDTDAFRQANANSLNQLSFVIGIQTDEVSAEVRGLFPFATMLSGHGVGPPVGAVAVGIGIDSTTVNGAGLFNARPINDGGDLWAIYRGPSGAGLRNLVWLEKGTGDPDSTTLWVGTTATQNSGMTGTVYA